MPELGKWLHNYIEKRRGAIEKYIDDVNEERRKGYIELEDLIVKYNDLELPEDK